MSKRPKNETHARRFIICTHTPNVSATEGATLKLSPTFRFIFTSCLNSAEIIVNVSLTIEGRLRQQSVKAPRAPVDAVSMSLWRFQSYHFSEEVIDLLFCSEKSPPRWTHRRKKSKHKGQKKERTVKANVHKWKWMIRRHERQHKGLRWRRIGDMKWRTRVGEHETENGDTTTHGHTWIYHSLDRLDWMWAGSVNAIGFEPVLGWVLVAMRHHSPFIGYRTLWDEPGLLEKEGQSMHDATPAEWASLDAKCAEECMSSHGKENLDECMCMKGNACLRPARKMVRMASQEAKWRMRAWQLPRRGTKCCPNQPRKNTSVWIIIMNNAWRNIQNTDRHTIIICAAKASLRHTGIPLKEDTWG